MENQESPLDPIPPRWEILSSKQEQKVFVIVVPKVRVRCFFFVQKVSAGKWIANGSDGNFTAKNFVTGEIMKAATLKTSNELLVVEPSANSQASKVEFYLGDLEFDFEEFYSPQEVDIEIRADFPIKGYLCLSGSPFAQANLEIEDGKIVVRIQRSHIGKLSETFVD